MKIYLIRHGQTTGDIEDRYGGDYDDYLTDLGKSQGRELVRNLLGFGIEKIFCSPRVRAKEIADIVNKDLNCGVEIIDDLRERNQYGILSGMTKNEARDKFLKLTEDLKDFHNTINGAENYDLFKNRIVKVLSEILNLKYNIIAIITHGGPIKVIFREVLKLGEVQIEDCGFAELEGDTHGLKVIRLNKIEISKYGN